jgi:hypothetical protein
MSVKLHPSWLEALGQEFDQPYMAVEAFPADRAVSGASSGSSWFRALD